MLFRILFFILLFPLTILASEVYIVKNIKISATDKSATMARNLAIDNGQIKAFNILVKQHFPDAIEEISALSNDKILNTVAGIELNNEKRSATNYHASLNVKFSKAQVDKLMKNHGATFQNGQNESAEAKPPSILPSELTSPTISSLIIPVYQENGKAKWADEESPWHDFLSKKFASLNSSHPKFILPIGDLEDLTNINKNILNRNIIDLSETLERYNVNNIVIAKLIKIEGEQPSYELQLNYINKFNSNWQHHNFAEINDNPEVFQDAFKLVDSFNFAKSQAKKEFNLIRSNSITVNFAVEGISDWLNFEGLLSSSQYFENLKLNSISLKNYNISFDYKISLEDLEEFLKANNYELSQTSKGKFTITKAVGDAQ